MSSTCSRPMTDARAPSAHPDNPGNPAHPAHPGRLRDMDLRVSYHPDNCADVIAEFYAPALSRGVRYDRTTYKFSGAGLAAAAGGLAGFLRNGGKMRLICDRETDRETMRALIEGGKDAAQALGDPAAALNDISPDDLPARDHLKLVAWLVKQGRLEVRIALHDGGIFHQKLGMIEDAAGDKVALDGSVNESLGGWRDNSESLSVFSSWEDARRAEDIERRFALLWEGKSQSTKVIPLPRSYDDYLRDIAPPDADIARIVRRYGHGAPPPEDPRAAQMRRTGWENIYKQLETNPDATLNTIPAELWPHQLSFWRKRVAAPVDRALIADEVGLGKTAQAAALLKTRLNQRRVKRYLIMTPRAAMLQWQTELRRKFNIVVPMLERRAGRYALVYPDGVAPDQDAGADAAQALLETQGCLVSYQWARRNIAAFKTPGLRYDMAIIDEAHNARFENVDNDKRRSPNRFLELLRGLTHITDGLLLLTATPMQLNESELWALLRLLYPRAWGDADYRYFYADPADSASAEPDDASRADWWQRRAAFHQFHHAHRALAVRPPDADMDIPARMIWGENRQWIAENLTDARMRESLAYMRRNSPAKLGMSRHTRDLLKRYQERGLLNAMVPSRAAYPVPIAMSAAEQALYNSIERLVKICYKGQAASGNRAAIGFINTVYYKRLGSSPYAFAQTVRNALARRAAPDEIDRDDVDALDMVDGDIRLEAIDADPEAIAALRRAEAAATALLGKDGKLAALHAELAKLRRKRHKKIIVFTQFKDTLEYLLERLPKDIPVAPLYGGDGADFPDPRETRLKRFNAQDEGILLCTETASESLNLQFCSAVINYDVPWNPMTLEQRIGRVDRIGQARAQVEAVNLFYEHSVERRAYQAMEERLKGITSHIGWYRPILHNKVTELIRRAQSGDMDLADADIRQMLDNALSEPPGFDIDSVNSDLERAPEPRGGLTMADLVGALTNPALLPVGWSAVPAGAAHWHLTKPDGSQYRVAVDRAAHEYAGGRVEFWAPGSPAFPTRADALG